VAFAQIAGCIERRRNAAAASPDLTALNPGYIAIATNRQKTCLQNTLSAGFVNINHQRDAIAAFNGKTKPYPIQF
jgi:hypothetical protein